MNDKAINYCWFTFGLLAFVCGLWQAYEEVYPFYWYRETVGTVREAKVEITVEKDSETGTENKYHRVKVTREYSVDGVTFTGTAMRNTGFVYYHGPDTKTWAKTRAAQFKVGEPIPVFYDPRDPQRSFAVIEFPWKNLIPVVLVLIIGSALMVATFSQIRKPPAVEKWSHTFTWHTRRFGK